MNKLIKIIKQNLYLYITLLIIIVIMILSILFIQNKNQNNNDNNIEITGFWIALAPKSSNITAGYGTIKNNGNTEDTLINISSDSANVMLHKTEIIANNARMIHLPNITINAKDKLVLRPMSYHLMFTNITANMRIIDNFVTLFFKFKKSGTIKIQAPIRANYY